MNTTGKKILLTFIIGTAIFVLGNLLFNGFHFRSLNDFMISFGFYQLYSFVLGFSNMMFFEYLDKDGLNRFNLRNYIKNNQEYKEY